MIVCLREESWGYMRWYDQLGDQNGMSISRRWRGRIIGPNKCSGKTRCSNGMNLSVPNGVTIDGWQRHSRRLGRTEVSREHDAALPWITRSERRKTGEWSRNGTVGPTMRSGTYLLGHPHSGSSNTSNGSLSTIRCIAFHHRPSCKPWYHHRFRHPLPSSVPGTGVIPSADENDPCILDYPVQWWTSPYPDTLCPGSWEPYRNGSAETYRAWDLWR